MSTALIPCLIGFGLAFLFALVVNAWRERFQAGIMDEPVVAPDASPSVSLLIPARDAAATLGGLLQDLHVASRDDPAMEVIVIDDGSTDGTTELVESMRRAWTQLQLLRSPSPGKKTAITAGVRTSHGALIILTDADARCGPHRIARIRAHQASERSDLVLLPVRTTGDGGLLGRCQELEQAALLGVAAATALSGAPVLANGANLAFTRAAFNAVGGFGGDPWASGDDLFLLRRMKKAGLRITYLLDREASVTVEAEATFRGFWRQRLRWAGKMRGVGGSGAWLGACGLLLPYVLFGITCMFDAAAAAGQGLLRGGLLLAGAWALWTVPVLALVRAVRTFQGERSPALMTLMALIAFSIYAPIIAVCALFVRPTWKGRRI